MRRDRLRLHHRMKRRLLNLLTALSLSICLMAVAFVFGLSEARDAPYRFYWLDVGLPGDWPGWFTPGHVVLVLAADLAVLLGLYY